MLADRPDAAASASVVHSSSVLRMPRSAFSTMPLRALYSVVTYWLRTICSSFVGGGRTISPAPGLAMASEM